MNQTSQQQAAAPLRQSNVYPFLPTNNRSRTQGQRANRCWQELAENHNVRELHPDEAARLARQLYQAGEITLLDLGILSLNSGYLSLNANYDARSNNSKQQDMLTEFRDRVIEDQRNNDQRNQTNNQRIVDILTKLDILRSCSTAYGN